jgi:hypothetical protein
MVPCVLAAIEDSQRSEWTNSAHNIPVRGKSEGSPLIQIVLPPDLRPHEPRTMPAETRHSRLPKMIDDPRPTIALPGRIAHRARTVFRRRKDRTGGRLLRHSSVLDQLHEAVPLAFREQSGRQDERPASLFTVILPSVH